VTLRLLSELCLTTTLIEENKKLKATIWEKQKNKYKKTREEKGRPAHKFQVNSKHSCEEDDPSDEALRKRFVR
jgi:hypothetical protein